MANTNNKRSDVYKVHLNKGKDHVYGGLSLFCNKHYGSDEVAKKSLIMKNDKNLAVLQVVGSYKVDELLKSRIKYLFDVDIEDGSYISVRASVFSNLPTRFDNVVLGEGDYITVYASNVKVETFDKKDGSKGHQISVSAYDFEIRNRKGGSSETPTEANTTASPADEFDFSEDDLPF